MAYLVAFSIKDDLSVVRDSSPELWRQVRRYNLPVQLALAAAEEIAAAATDRSTAEIISLAPCQPGSGDLFRWSEGITERLRTGSVGDTRMNPTHTLHVVDNLAMSVFAIAHRNREYCLGLGGAAGQAWAALEIVVDRLAAGLQAEALVMAGDQKLTTDHSTGVGVALLFSASPRRYDGRNVRLLSVRRRRHPHRDKVVPHSANGLRDWLHTIEMQGSERLSYVVPFEHSDGIDEVTVDTEVSECAAATVY